MHAQKQKWPQLVFLLQCSYFGRRDYAAGMLFGTCTPASLEVLCPFAMAIWFPISCLTDLKAAALKWHGVQKKGSRFPSERVM